MTRETSNISSNKKVWNPFSRLTAILAVTLTLSGCSNSQQDPQQDIQQEYINSKEEEKKASREVTELTAKWEQQRQNYEEVSKQENIQQDLKEAWADPSINSSIRHSHDRANDLDKDIAKTEEELSEAQIKLAKAKEKLAMAEAVKKEEEAKREEANKQRLNPHKYDHIKEQQKRSIHQNAFFWLSLFVDFSNLNPSE